ALQYAHDQGVIHRDLNPKNVFLARIPGAPPSVKLLDFGISKLMTTSSMVTPSQWLVMGTASYMSPEQAAGKRLSPASDWYSVGVMLYEALTGRQPFRGRALDVLARKQEKDPPPPSDLVAGIPLDLNWLSTALLRRDPTARPPGDEVLRRLGSAPTDPPGASHAPSPPLRQAEFVGREEHLNVLNDALRVMQRRRTVVTYVHGPLGVGKTTLVKQFLDQVRQREESVVLSGRCHESESVPYKALDSLVDALSHYLVRLPRLEAEALLPRDVDAISRVFPVLRRVEAVADSPRLPFDVSDQQELRQRAVDGLRELLARVGDRKTLVLSIDDLHWGDLDSVAMLSDLLRPPRPPVLLLVVCYRMEDRAASPMSRAILDLQLSSSQHVDVCDLEIEPLSDQEARQLASALIGGDDPGAEQLSQAIARESGGSPYFLEALVRHQEGTAQLPNGSPAKEVASLDEMLWDRITSFPDPARRLLEAVAVAGHPIRQADAFEAAGLSREGHDALGLLRMANMIHVGGESLKDEIQAYDERVRRTVIAHVSPDTAAMCHQRLALALESSDQADPATVAAHYVGADAPEKAGRWYAIAARKAADSMAFDNAAELYRIASQLHPLSGDAERDFRRRLADSLGSAGRGAEAAEEYLRAAGGAPDAEALQLRRSAATQFLSSGHVDEGLAALRTVLAAVGMKLPKTRRRAVFSLFARRARVRFRGVEFRERDSSHMAPKDLWKIDICWSAALGLSMVDTVTAAGFQARHLLLALRSGEPYRIARALALEAVQVAIAGGRARRRAERYLEQAMALARRVDKPHALGVVSMAAGIVACLQGRWLRAVELADEAEKTFREDCTDVAWELETTQLCALWALRACGAVDELSRRAPLAMPEANQRQDAPSLARLDLVNLPRLAANDPEGAERELGEKAAECWEDRFHVERFHRLFAHVQIDLYRGDGQRARLRIMDAWRSLNRSCLLRVQLLRVTVDDALARAALCEAADAADPKPLLSTAERHAKRLRREKEPWVEPLAELTLAAVAASRGRRSKATTLLRDAISRFDALDMPLRAACARRRLGELIGGASGSSLVEETDSWMA
ncbi:MAG: AAA family ATPase, partial [Planctomycetes bacterium]|nr:AAA family ATPase [Planctomycetota bacterium]